jgi:hypothetical protein
MSNPHPRSAGVTAAATLAILYGISALLIWGSLFLALLNAPPDVHGRHIYETEAFAFVMVVFVVPAMIALLIRTGIGIFQLRSWARWAALLWASLALVFCLAVIAFRPFETFFFPHHFVSEVVSLKQMIAISFVFMLLPISVWWLFYLRSEGVKKQFSAAGAEAPAPEPSVLNKA